MRLYLINSPVVRAENLRFKEEGVKEILKDLFLPWYNAYRFFIQNIKDSSVSRLYNKLLLFKQFLEFTKLYDYFKIIG